VFTAKYQLKRVIATVLICASFRSLCCLLRAEKLIFLNKQCFYRNNEIFSGINSVWVLSFGTDTAPQSFLPLVYCTADDTLFELGTEIRLLFRWVIVSVRCFWDALYCVKHCAIINAISYLIILHAFWKVTVRTVMLILSLQHIPKAKDTIFHN